MKKIVLIFLTVLVLCLVANTNDKQYYVIPKNSIRIRIVPNSNSVKDQYLKNQVRTNIEQDLTNDLKNVKSISESRQIISNNIPEYKKTIETVLKTEKSNQKYNIDYGYHHFPKKEYKGVIYNEGNYESLLITLGNAKGDNWWCVLFPPLCLIEEEETKDIQYSTYIKEIFQKYQNQMQ